jgi:hypothetical protein
MYIAYYISTKIFKRKLEQFCIVFFIENFLMIKI